MSSVMWTQPRTCTQAFAPHTLAEAPVFLTDPLYRISLVIESSPTFSIVLINTEPLPSPEEMSLPLKEESVMKTSDQPSQESRANGWISKGWNRSTHLFLQGHQRGGCPLHARLQPWSYEKEGLWSASVCDIRGGNKFLDTFLIVGSIKHQLKKFKHQVPDVVFQGLLKQAPSCNRSTIVHL